LQHLIEVGCQDIVKDAMFGVQIVAANPEVLGNIWLDAGMKLFDPVSGGMRFGIKTPSVQIVVV